MGRPPEFPERNAASAASAAKALIAQDRRFTRLLAGLPPDVDAAIEALEWEYDYLAWMAKLKRATKSLPPVPRLTLRALRHLRQLRAEGNAAVGRLTLAYKRARIVCEEVELCRRVGLTARLRRPVAWKKGGRLTMLGALALREALRLGLKLDASHYTLIGVYCFLEAEIDSREKWDLAVDRWQHRIGTVKNLEKQLKSLLPREHPTNSR